MKLLLENWKRFLNEVKEMVCPKATQDLELNTKNRNAAIKAEHIQYGPLNLADEEYWVRAAKHWNTKPEIAKKSKCANCTAFDISEHMKHAMGISFLLLTAGTKCLIHSIVPPLFETGVSSKLDDIIALVKRNETTD